MNTLTASLTPNEWEYIATFLGQRPWTEVNLLLMKLQSQIGPQMAAQAKAFEAKPADVPLDVPPAA